ncbi:hypothetical protein ACT29H_01850 [Thermophagus sp. OGC60D27]
MKRSMIKYASHKSMISSCEFHPTNGLTHFYTDETSMATFATKVHV